MEWYEIKNVHQVESPSLLIYLDRVVYNINQAIKIVGDPSRLRPHVKTHKSADITSLMLQKGISKFKCATIAEAEMLALQNVPDVLIAFPVVGPNVDRFITLINTYPFTSFSCLVDDIDDLAEYKEKSIPNGRAINLFLDLDVGMHRTGIRANEKASELVNGILSNKAFNFKGFHIYDGHIRDQDIHIRTLRSNEAYSQAKSWIDTLAVAHPFEIICGGSPTFVVHAQRPEVVCSPGTFVYWDYSFVQMPDSGDFLPAAILLSRVVSKPDTIITTDLGHKAVASENELTKRVHFLNDNDLQPIGQSEEHLQLKNSNRTYKKGDILYGLPFHICPTVALHEYVLVVQNHEIIDQWQNIARKRKINI